MTLVDHGCQVSGVRCIGKLSDGFWKVSDGLAKVSDGLLAEYLKKSLIRHFYISAFLPF